jgi:membrane-associated protease RseP (regulator of RpoE activity)
MRKFLLNVVAPLALAVLTFCTTVMTGILLSGNAYITLLSIREGIPYALGALTVLVAHALGHYVQARLNKVQASTPYFIPALGFVGTVGAYTKIKWPISDRNALVKIFAVGPICGFFAAWVVLIIGLFLSQVIDSESVDSSLQIGNSIILRITSIAVLGNIQAKKDVILHPVAYAGLLGLFYNFCHLLPIGRFDGGRLVYAIWGYRTTQRISFVMIGILLFLGFILEDSATWFIIAILGALSSVGFRHQYPSDRYDQPLSKSLIIILVIIVAIIIVSFSPKPVLSLSK